MAFLVQCMFSTYLIREIEKILSTCDSCFLLNNSSKFVITELTLLKNTFFFHFLSMIENNPSDSFISFRYSRMYYVIYKVCLRLTENRSCFRVFHEEQQWYSQEIGFEKLCRRSRAVTNFNWLYLVDKDQKQINT